MKKIDKSIVNKKKYCKQTRIMLVSFSNIIQPSSLWYLMSVMPKQMWVWYEYSTSTSLSIHPYPFSLPSLPPSSPSFNTFLSFTLFTSPSSPPPHSTLLSSTPLPPPPVTPPVYGARAVSACGVGEPHHGPGVCAEAVVRVLGTHHSGQGREGEVELTPVRVEWALTHSRVRTTLSHCILSPEHAHRYPHTHLLIYKQTNTDKYKRASEQTNKQTKQTKQTNPHPRTYPPKSGPKAAHPWSAYCSFPTASG